MKVEINLIVLIDCMPLGTTTYPTCPLLSSTMQPPVFNRFMLPYLLYFPTRQLDRDQLWYAYVDKSRDYSKLKNVTPIPCGILGGQMFKSPGNVTNC